MITVGVLALQGAFSEHVQLLRVAAASLSGARELDEIRWNFLEVRTADDLAACQALILPGGESTTISLLAARSGLLEPLRDFVKVHRRPTWGTCAGLILLSEAANRTKKGGQELIGGLDVRTSRNHFGRQTESFHADLDVSFMGSTGTSPFRAVFIRAPVVERVLRTRSGIQEEELQQDSTVVAPSRQPEADSLRSHVEQDVEILARLPKRSSRVADQSINVSEQVEDGDIIAVRQANVFGTSFHPELTGDARIHAWWLRQVLAAVEGASIG